MTTVWLFIAALILAVSVTTYALTRLAPTGTLPPRGAVAAIRFLRWFAEGDNAIALTAIISLMAFVCFAVWAFINYPLLSTSAAATLLTIISVIAFIRRRPQR